MSYLAVSHVKVYLEAFLSRAYQTIQQLFFFSVQYQLQLFVGK